MSKDTLAVETPVPNSAILLVLWEMIHESPHDALEAMSGAELTCSESNREKDGGPRRERDRMWLEA